MCALYWMFRSFPKTKIAAKGRRKASQDFKWARPVNSAVSCQLIRVPSHFTNSINKTATGARKRTSDHTVPRRRIKRWPAPVHLPSPDLFQRARTRRSGRVSASERMRPLLAAPGGRTHRPDNGVLDRLRHAREFPTPPQGTGHARTHRRISNPS